MDADQLRADLQEAARRVPSPPADLALTVLARRRSSRRQRAALLGASLAVVLIAAGLPMALGAWRGGPDSRAAVGDAAVYSLPTRGSLAGDQAFLSGLRQLPWVFDQSYQTTDGSGYTAGTDLAAAIPAGDRHVVFAGDVPGGRWALLVTPTVGGYAAAWFTGPAGATPGQMTMSGAAQLVTDGQPIAHVDRANPDTPLVVVAAPGDDIGLSPAATIDGSGQLHRDYRSLETTDGIATVRLHTSLRYGLSASVRVERGGQPVFRARPTAAGDVAGLPPVDPDGLGWTIGDPETPQILADRTGASLGTSRALTDSLLGSLFGPTGLTLQDIAASGPQITELYSGDRTGPASPQTERRYVQPVLTLWDIKLPSGAHGLLAGWATVTTEDSHTHQQTLLALRPDTFDPALDLVATRMALPAAGGAPAEDVLILSGPHQATQAEILDSAGTVLRTVDLLSGAGVVPTPDGAATVRMIGSDGRRVAEGAIEASIAPSAFGDYGDSPLTLLAAITPPAPSTSPAATTPGTPAGGATQSTATESTAAVPGAAGSNSPAPGSGTSGGSNEGTSPAATDGTADGQP
jgi:hypothetical protein